MNLSKQCRQNQVRKRTEKYKEEAQQRAEEIKTLGEIKSAGSSLAFYLAAFCLQVGFLCEGWSGMTAEKLHQDDEKLTALALYNVVMLIIGGNDLCPKNSINYDADYQIEYAYRHMAELFARLKLLNPKMKVYCTTIMPRSTNPAFQPAINDFNWKLVHDPPEHLSGVLDLRRTFKKAHLRDGVHLNDLGNTILISTIYDYFGSINKKK